MAAYVGIGLFKVINESKCGSRCALFQIVRQRFFNIAMCHFTRDDRLGLHTGVLFVWL